MKFGNKLSRVNNYKSMSLPVVSGVLLSLTTMISHAEGNETSRELSTITVLGSEATENAEIGGTPVKELPINVHVVNQEEIERLRFVDPDEVLDRIPGETQVRNLRIPDGGKGYTIPMVDGIPLENPYEGATQRLDRVNTSDIQRIEVIKGPASAIYPSNAFGGVINVVTKDAPLTPETEVWLEAGEFNRRRGGLNTGGTINKFGYFFDINTRNLDGLREGVKNDRDQVSGKLIFDATDTTRLITRIEHLKEDVVTRGDLSAEEINEDPTQSGSLDSATDLEQDSISFKIEQLFDNSNLDFSFVYREKDTIGLSRFRGPQDENDKGYNAKLLYRYDFENSNFITGFETYDGTQNTDNYARNDNDLEGGVQTRQKGSRDIRALFVQYESSPLDRLGITVGARYEDIKIVSSSPLADANDIVNGSTSFTELSPKFGMTYQVSPTNLVWLGISRGFYAPDIDDVFGTAGVAETVNLDLDAEIATNVEIGLRGQVGDWSYDTSYYHNEIKNYLVTEEFFDINNDEQERTTNAGQVTVQGLESVVEYAPKNANWRVGFTHTYSRNIYDKFVSDGVDLSGNELRRSPRHHFNGRIAWLPTQKLTLELEGDFYTTYYGDNANSEEGRFKRDERINLRVSYDNGPWRLWLHGLNLTDTLEDRGTFSRGALSFRTVDGRSLYAGLAYRF